MKSGRCTPLIGLAILSTGAVSIALYTQVFMSALPCAWCILQRISCLALLFLAALSLSLYALKAKNLSRIVALTGVFPSLFGLWSAYNQIESVRKMNDCGISLANKWLIDWDFESLSQTFFQVKASCSDASFPIFGTPMEFFSFVFFLSAFSLSIIATTKK